MRAKNVLPCVFEGQTLNNTAEMLHPSLVTGAERGASVKWTVAGVVAELAARQSILRRTPATDAAPTAAVEVPAVALAPLAATGTAAAAALATPAAAPSQWSPQRLMGMFREAIVSVFAHPPRALNLQARVAGRDAVAAPTEMQHAQPAPLSASVLSSIFREPDLRAPYAYSAKAYVAGVAERFSELKRLTIPERLKWPDRFLLWYGAYTPPGQDYPLPPLWLAAKRYENVGEIWGTCVCGLSRACASHSLRSALL